MAGLARAAGTATSAASAKGQIAALMGGRRGLTQLQRSLAGVGRVLAVALSPSSGFRVLAVAVAAWPGLPDTAGPERGLRLLS